MTLQVRTNGGRAWAAIVGGEDAEFRFQRLFLDRLRQPTRGTGIALFGLPSIAAEEVSHPLTLEVCFGQPDSRKVYELDPQGQYRELRSPRGKPTSEWMSVNTPMLPPSGDAIPDEF